MAVGGLRVGVGERGRGTCLAQAGGPEGINLSLSLRSTLPAPPHGAWHLAALAMRHLRARLGAASEEGVGLSDPHARARCPRAALGARPPWDLTDFVPTRGNIYYC